MQALKLTRRQKYDYGLDIQPLRDVSEAHFIPQPSFAKTKKKSRVRQFARGHAYEGRVKTALEGAFGAAHLSHGQWMQWFLCDGTSGYCQSDFYVPCSDRVLVFEAKLTAVQRAHRQLKLRYGPLLALILDRPPVLIQVARYVTPETTNIIRPKDIPLIEPTIDRVFTLPLFV